ncbi:MAG: calcineurin [Myxococcales bacterium]|nr:calcineurin [Myxococcales bacterium]
MLPTILRASRRTWPYAGHLACIFVFACQGKSKTEPEEPRPQLPSESATAAPTPVVQAVDPAKDDCPIKARPLRHEQRGRLVAIGDLHGDLAATRRALRLAGAIGETDAWVGGDLLLVQTGDILDRGDDEQGILDLFEKLSEEAKAAGGEVFQLQGNHELMNAMGDFRYVTRGGFVDFVEGGVSVPLTAEARSRALFPGGRYAKKLADHDMVTIVGDSVFVHGGVLPRFTEGLEKSNRDARCYLLGALEEPPPVVLDPEGPLWTRAFSKPETDCAELARALDGLGVARMVVGHTPQLGGITSACGDKVWRIDTGMASYYRGPTEVLEIDQGVAKVLRQ